jgi:D-alanyl-D-alanine carboxypeptidase (penicillin-binding protein 5/6)
MRTAKKITSILLIISFALCLLSSCFFRSEHISGTGTLPLVQSTTAETTPEVTVTTEEITTTEPPVTTTEEVFPPDIPFSNVSDAILNVRAQNAFVYNVTDGMLLAMKGDGEHICPASVTKLLSILYALSVCPENYEITPKAEELAMVGKGSSTAYIKTKHRLTVAQLVKGMLLPSGNDAAYVLAAGVGRYVANNPTMNGADAVALFMQGVNEYAAELGCTGTLYTVPDGLAGDEHYTSTHDLILVGQAVLKNELMMSYTKIVSERVRYASGHYMTWNNTNRLINPDDSYYSPYVTGLKTGSLTDNFCIYVSAEINGCQYLIGIFGSPTKNSRYDDAHILLDALLGKE